MPYYKPLEYLPSEESVHIINNLQQLREKLKSEIPVRTNRSTLLLCTWNIREFSDSRNRCEEAFWYIGEIISFFDLVAVQEIGNNMSALSRIMSVLGYKYDYIVTDTPNAEGGNERMAFIFNTGKVKFKNIAGEISLSSKEELEFELPEGFARPPFIVAFQASWFKFYLCNVHIYYGTETTDARTGKKDKDRRRREISALAQKLNKRAQKEDATYILMGDFNIERKGDVYYTALVGENDKTTGFFIHPKKSKMFTNKSGDKEFDQIAFNVRNITSSNLGIDIKDEKVKMGVVNFYDTVFQDIDYYRTVAEKLYQKEKKAFPDPWDTKAFETWKTFQMSDHLPFWMELRIDFTDEYLQKMKMSKINQSQNTGNEDSEPDLIN
jgi:exonuclease III